jgi:hypothetical protein
MLIGRHCLTGELAAHPIGRFRQHNAHTVTRSRQRRRASSDARAYHRDITLNFSGLAQ